MHNGNEKYCHTQPEFTEFHGIDDMLGSLSVALPDNADMRRGIQNLVAERWDKADVPLFMVAYVLTPHYYSHSWLTSLAPGGKKS